MITTKLTLQSFQTLQQNIQKQIKFIEKQKSKLNNIQNEYEDLCIELKDRLKLKVTMLSLTDYKYHQNKLINQYQGDKNLKLKDNEIVFYNNQFYKYIGIKNIGWVDSGYGCDIYYDNYVPCFVNVTIDEVFETFKMELSNEQ